MIPMKQHLQQQQQQAQEHKKAHQESQQQTRVLEDTFKNVSRYRYNTFRKKVSRYKILLQMYLDTRYKILLNILHYSLKGSNPSWSQKMTEKLNTNKWKQISIDSWKTTRFNPQIIKSFPLHSSRKCMQCKVKKSIVSAMHFYRYFSTYFLQIHCSQIQWKDTKNVSRYVSGRYSIRYFHTLQQTQTGPRARSKRSGWQNPTLAQNYK